MIALDTSSAFRRRPRVPTRAFLQAAFRGAALGLPAKAYAELVGHAASAGIYGGAIYDALIAATAKRARAVLLTRDRRAVPTYEKVGVQFELIGT